MTTYYNKTEIYKSMKFLVKECLQECRDCKELPVELVDLLKHNFLAKFVHYNSETNNIEIGIKESKSDSDSYPEITIYSYPLDGNQKWVNNSLKKDNNDMVFYGQLLNRKNLLFKDAEVILM